MLIDILIVTLVLVLISAIPSWPYSKDWGYWPSGIAGILLIAVIILLLTHRI